jgi:hypothetical protein
MVQLGQTETLHRRVGTSGLRSAVDIAMAVRPVSEGPILLQKSADAEWVVCHFVKSGRL